MTTKTASLISTSYNVIGFIIAGLIFFPDEVSSTILLCALLYPLAGILIMIFGKEQIKFFSNIKLSRRPEIMLGFLPPTLGLFFTSYDAYRLLHNHDLLIPGIAIGVVIFLLLYFTGIIRSENAIPQIFMMIVCPAMFSVGALITINCRFDESAPIKFNTIVESKKVEQSKGNKHYKLTLTPWERGQQPIIIEVDKTLYEQTPVDGPVGGHIKSGYLHIRWFYLDM